ncbi:hypothetical protein [Aeromonas hydrophila]
MTKEVTMKKLAIVLSAALLCSCAAMPKQVVQQAAPRPALYGEAGHWHRIDQGNNTILYVVEQDSENRFSILCKDTESLRIQAMINNTSYDFHSDQLGFFLWIGGRYYAEKDVYSSANPQSWFDYIWDKLRHADQIRIDPLGQDEPLEIATQGASLLPEKSGCRI